MIDYNPAKKEIKAAKKCIHDMESSNNFDDMEQLWRNYLNHIEKSFTKLLSATSAVKGKFSNTFSKEYSLRNGDELLRYIKQARDSDNHTIEDISKKIYPSMTINPLPGSQVLKFDKLFLYGDGGMYIEGDPALIEFHPGSIEVIAVTNRGSKCNPPTSHNGNEISTKDPVKLAKYGVAFYEAWIEKSRKIFP